MKTCPYCAEEIQDEAIVCRYCGRELAPKAVARVSSTLGQAPAREPTPLQAEPGAQVKVSTGVVENQRSRRQRNPWRSALIAGLVLGLLGAIPRFFQLMEVSTLINTGQLPELSFRMSTQNLLLGAVAGTIAWTLVTAALIALWRWNRNVVLALLGLGLVILVVIAAQGSFASQLSMPLISASNIPVRQVATQPVVDAITARPTVTKPQPATIDAPNTGIPTWAPEGAHKTFEASEYLGQNAWFCGEVNGPWIRDTEPRVVFVTGLVGIKNPEIHFYTSQFGLPDAYWRGLGGQALCVLGVPQRGGVITSEYRIQVASPLNLMTGP